MTAVPVIAIDGPGGAGKGTISQLVAQRLGWHLLDSGSLYRITAFAARARGAELPREGGAGGNNGGSDGEGGHFC